MPPIIEPTHIEEAHFKTHTHRQCDVILVTG